VTLLLNIQPILDTRNEVTGSSVGHEAIVLSSRLRLARNLAGHRFPSWASSSQRHAVLAACEPAIASLPAMREGLVLEIAQLSELERQVLVERHLISRELSAHSDGAGIAVNRDQSCAIMINEEDHLRIQVLRRGFALEEAWSAIDAVDTALEASLDFAFTGGRGYLTACPTNVGTGLRASVMMHLPALVLSGHMEKVVRFANQLNLAVRGLFGEGSDASGSIFQISNQQTLGEEERTIVEKLRGVLRAVVEGHEHVGA